MCNPTTLDVEARGSEVQGHPSLYTEFETIMGYRLKQVDLFKQIAL